MGSSKRGPRSDDEESVPEYSVEEDGNGLLVNHNKRLIWPSKKPMSEEGFRRIVSVDASPTSSTECADLFTEFGSSARSASRSSKKKTGSSRSLLKSSARAVTSLYELDSDIISDDLKSIKEASPMSGGRSVTKSTSMIDRLAKYIGIRTPEQAEIQTEATCFRLYHRFSSETPISISFPLFMVYKNSDGQSVHYRVNRRQRLENGTICNYWTVDYGSEFLSLSALVRHYGLYSNYDPETGAIEAFESWE